MKITKEQFELLNKYESQLHSSVYDNFIRVIDYSMVSDVQSVYICLTGDKNLNLMCNNCIMKLFIYVGKIYFEYKKNNILENGKEVDQQNNTEGTTGEIIKERKKAGRPKRG